MRDSVVYGFLGKALFLAAVVALSACAGLQSSMPATTGAMPSWQAMHAARPACAPARVGEAQCLVLVQSEGAVSPLIVGWEPSNLQTRYKLPSKSKGSGQVVAVVDAYDNPNVASDLAKYRSAFGLGTAKFRKYNEDGEQGNYPAGSEGWGVEIDLDAQMVSASCPRCTIYLIEANSDDGSDLSQAEAEAVKLGAHIVSNSWICYGSTACVNQSDFDHAGILYLGSSGDEGENKNGAPSALDSVAAIGGTVLSENGSGYKESVWPDSGGGCETAIKKPAWQDDTFCDGRAVADGSAVAWDVAEYDSYGYGGWFEVGGTSVASPLVAGMFALAGNATKQDGGRTFWETAHHKDLYDVCGSSCLSKTYSYGGGWGSPDGLGAL